MNKFFNKKINIVISVAVILLSVVIVFTMFFKNGSISAGESTADMVMAKARVKSVPTTQVITTVEQTTATTEPTTAQPTTKKTKTTKPVPTTTVPFATAIPPKTVADHQAQLNAGYLVAIDNPDLTYKCGKVTLSDADRDLLERLCMGEFGGGGVTGAALVAQAVKDAICFDGFTSIQAVIDNYHYSGRTDIPANEDCKRAVRYIFDENHDAVQHRLLYMYNPSMVQSSFHESQNYIMSYLGVRFFDRWGY